MVNKMTSEVWEGAFLVMFSWKVNLRKNVFAVFCIYSTNSKCISLKYLLLPIVWFTLKNGKTSSTLLHRNFETSCT